MATVLHPDPFAAKLVESPALLVTLEQQNIIRRVLELACSDSRFAQKAWDAIWHVLTIGIAPTPVVSSINPSSAPIGSGMISITVTGTGFTNTSEVIFNGAEAPTLFVGPTELTGVVDTNKFITPGQTTVGVLDIDVLSNLIRFNLTAPTELGSIFKPEDKILESKKAAEVLDRKK